MKLPGKDIAFLALVLGTLLVLLAFSKRACAQGVIRTAYMSEEKTERVLIHPGKLTVLSFPVKPDTTALGPQCPFALKYIENDIIISGPAGAKTNMFVYLFGRRFGFEIMTTNDRFDEVVHVKDALARPEKKKSHGK